MAYIPNLVADKSNAVLSTNKTYPTLNLQKNPKNANKAVFRVTGTFGGATATLNMAPSDPAVNANVSFLPVANAALTSAGYVLLDTLEDFVAVTISSANGSTTSLDCNIQ